MSKLTIKLNENFGGNIVLDITKIISESVNPKKQIISEALTKTDISEIQKLIDKSFNKEFMKDVEKKITEMVKKEITGKENEQMMLEVAQNVLIQFTKQLYIKRGFWKNLHNKAS